MKKIYLAILLVGASIMLQGCFTYGEFTASQYTKINSSICATPPSSMYLFFEDEQIPFSYEKVGLVEAQGHEFASYEEVLDHLQYQAWENCANALLFIKSGYTDRIQGYFGPDVHIEEVYASKYFEAIAVKIDIDDEFLYHYGYGEDMSFIDRVREDRRIQKNQNNMEIAGSVTIGVLTILDAILWNQD